jgi:protein involved in polysaccharide export with SLBB domain
MSGGDIPLPVAGAVPVEGLTEAQAAARIQTALLPYLRLPTVDVQIVQQSQSIFFTGSMIGVQPYQPGETLGTAIGAFGQKTADAQGNSLINAGAIDLRNVRIQRDGKALPAVNLETLARTGDSGPRLEPGDLVLLAAKPVRVDIRGDLKNPGAVYLYPDDTLAQAVAEAGGYSSTTSLNAIVLHRNGVDQTVSSAGSVFTAPAHDGDVLTLQPAPHVSVLGMVQKPGDTTLQNSSTLLSAVYAAGGPSDHADLAHIKVVHGDQTQTYSVSRLLRGDLTQNAPVHDGDIVFIPQGHRIDPGAVFGTIAGMASLKFLLGL